MISHSSCVSYKKTALFQNIPNASINEKDSTSEVEYQLKIQPGDILKISIKTSSGGFDNLFEDKASTTLNYNEGNAYYAGYVVDYNGNVIIPIIGELNVLNLTLTEARDLLVTKLKNYLVDPYVEVKFMTFRIEVLGEVHRPGLLTISNEKATLIDAIAISGDLTDLANRQTIRVIRKSSLDQQKSISIDLTSPEAFRSEAFNLKPNDLILVDPLPRKFYLTNVSTILGAIAAVNTAFTFYLTFYQLNKK